MPERAVLHAGHFQLGLNEGCCCPDCWDDDANIRAEMRHAGVLRRRADAELLAAGITEFVSREPVTGERGVLMNAPNPEIKKHLFC